MPACKVGLSGKREQFWTDSVFDTITASKG